MASSNVVLPVPLGPVSTVVPSGSGLEVGLGERPEIASRWQVMQASPGLAGGAGTHDTRTGINRYR